MSIRRATIVYMGCSILLLGVGIIESSFVGEKWKISKLKKLMLNTRKL